MLPFIQKEPAAVAAAIVAVLNVLQLTGVVSLDGDTVSAINIALIAVLGLFVRQTSTSTADPTLKAGTTVNVQGSEDKVVIETSPPGPVGVEGGTSEDLPFVDGPGDGT